MKKILVLFVLLSVTFFMFAQTIRDAEFLFNEKRYDEAIEVYEKLLVKQPKDYVLKCKVGHCLVDMHRYEEAIPLLELAAEKNVKRAFLYLYDAYFYTYQFSKAFNALNNYVESNDGKIINDMEYNSKLVKANLGASMLSRVEDVAILDSVKLLKSELLSAYRLSSELGSLELYFEIAGMKTDKQQVVYYTGKKDKMILSKKMEGGQLDLNVSYHLVDGWTKEADLSSVINSPYDENYPFELPDGITLYFSSMGHNSLGGYDIFMSRYSGDANGYSEPINIGMPFNSPANDYMLAFDEMTHIGWFATDRFQSGDTVVVYEFIPNQEKILLKTDDSLYRKNVAQLKEYRKGKLSSLRDAIVVDSLQKKETEINFMVNDGVIYTRLNQFVSEEAKALYLKLQTTDKRLATLERLLEGKRREYYLSSIETDKQELISEILKLESEVNRYEELVKEYLLQTRREELNQINKQ